MSFLSTGKLLTTATIVSAIGLSACHEAGTVTREDTGQAFPVEDAQASATQDRSVRLVNLSFEGLRLQFFFAGSVDGPASLELRQGATSEEAVAQGATFEDNEGFEGGPRQLCAVPALGGFPVNAAKAGTLTIDSVEKDGGEFVDAHGAIHVEFEHCTVESLGLSDAPLVLTATF
jgi:hypothetical protein